MRERADTPPSGTRNKTPSDGTEGGPSGGSSRVRLFISGSGLGQQEGPKGVVTEAFTGEFYQKVDSKARVSIPSAMRRVLDAANPLAGKRTSVFMVWGAGGRFAQCYSERGIKALHASIASIPNDDDMKEDLELAYITRVSEVEIDEDGRLVLPQKVRDRMGVTPEILAAGFTAAFAAKTDHFDLWLGENYEAANPKKEFDPKALRARLPVSTG